MKPNQQSGIINGVVGGMIAGALIALWFLVVDVIAADALRTPARLGATLFDRPFAGGAATVPQYTLLHFGIFGIVGGVTGWLLAATGTVPRLTLGLFFGICVLNGIHYIGLLATDERLLTVLPWPHVVGANLLAGVALMWFIHWASDDEHALGVGMLRHHPLLAEGLKVGMLGAVAVAAWFLLVDIVSGEPLRTPAALGSALFLGATGADDIVRTPAVIAAYTVLHLVAFACIGVAFVAVARGIERLPSLALIALLGAIVLEAVTFSSLVAFGSWVLGTLSLWAIGIANLLAVAVMGWWIWRTHPVLRESMLREGLASAP